MTKDYPKGAEWRKWDLHVHTPDTAKNDQYKSENKWDDYITQLETITDISVLGITDYFSIDNYKKVKGIQDNGRIQNFTIIPNIELRLLPVTDKETPINLHVLFDPNMSIETIEREFFRNLKFTYKENTYSCQRSDLISLGKAYDNSITEDHKAWQVGIGQFNVSYSDLKTTLGRKSLEEKHLVGVSNSSKDGNSGIQHSSLAATREEIYRLSDFIFSGSSNDINFFLGKNSNKEEFIKKYGSLKPCMIGSDAHSFMQLGKFPNDKITWIKADPTFDGLKQVINEPDERVYIGEQPPLFKKIANNRTKYIKNIVITQADDYDKSQGVWFDDVHIPLNNELVAIIGNKGSGKSAITDIISLCSNYYDDNDFSFLSPKKFKEKKNRIAKNFEATLTWEAGTINKKNLAEPPDEDEARIKYLPQGQFERLTNEISTVEEFQKEIESVVFSHIPESERLNALSFSELIDKKTITVNYELESLKVNIKSINELIIKLEEKSTPTYKSAIENKLKIKNEELKALIEPQVIPNPNEDPDKKKDNEAANKKIEELKIQIQKLEGGIKNAQSEKKGIVEALQKLTTTKQEVLQKSAELTNFIEEKKEQLSEFEIDVSKLISIETDYIQIDTIIARLKTELNKVKEKLGEESIIGEDKSIIKQLDGKQNELKTEQGKLNNEQQLYQKYLLAKSDWEKQKKMIIGSIDTVDTIEYYESEINYLDNELKNELDKKYTERIEITRHIFDRKQEIIDVYVGAGNKLNSIIEENSDTLQNYKISIDASIVKKIDLNSKFLDFILQNKAGSFYSKEGGEKQFSSMLADIDFDKKESVLNLLNKIIDALRFDKRDNQKNEQRSVTDQIKNGDSLEVYNYLFSLGFLGNNYQLKQGDKEIEKLSPGERGALLLVFYLLLDKNNIPLIIDQPEDNLDNNSVATVLVPFIRAAKKKRQIIMVTHNPNLAVVADAEQVIYASLDKENNYSFSVQSGSIENKEINKKIVEVLEGAMPAFNKRSDKYYREV